MNNSNGAMDSQNKVKKVATLFASRIAHIEAKENLWINWKI
ncbi:MAG: hypothetical protein RR416_02965 [Clostridia bacterium]